MDRALQALYCPVGEEIRDAMSTTAKRPTILDVARAAGVSVGSVSNVINGTRPVSEELKEQVETAAATLGFRMNSLAQTLRRRRSGTVGLCTTNVGTVYLRELANALDEIAAENGYELIQVLTRQEPKRELQRANSLMSRQVDGIVLLPSLQPQAALDAIARSRTPAVIVDRLCEDDRFSYVIVDNRGAMRQLVQSLTAKSHRRLLFVAQNLGVVTTRHRLGGLEEEARASGGALRYEAIERGSDEASFVERLRSMLAQPHPPTALITGNSSVALSTLQAFQAIGIRVPDQIALATFDDPEWATVLSPPLTTVRVPFREIAAATWSLLHAQIEGKQDSPQVVSIATELVERASSILSLEAAAE
jgi:LacI family transcriptional regulator